MDAAENNEGKMAEKKRKELWMVRNFKGADGEDRSFWTKIGSAFENKDGSYSLVFDAFPIDGRAQLRATASKGKKDKDEGSGDED